LAESNATGAETGKDGNAAGNADYVTKAEFEALNTSLATIATTLKGLPNMVNKAAQDHAGRQLKALGLTPEAIAKLTAPPKTEGEGEGEGEGEDPPPKPKGKGGKQPEAGAQQGQQPDIEALLKKQAADIEAKFSKEFKTLEESTKVKLAEAEQKRQAAERARIETLGATKARELLSKQVIPDAADLAFDALVKRGHLHIAEDGTPYYRGNPSDEDSQVAFADGVAEFLKTPGAKVFLPAPQQKGGKQPPSKTPLPPLPQNGGGASIFDRLNQGLAAEGVNIDEALS
jgi:hypothetical protein